VSPDAEALRRAALEILGPFGDARAERILTTADLDIEADVAVWEGSEGQVHGHRVRLGVDGAGLAQLQLSPAVADAVTAALSAALAETPGNALVDVVPSWSRERPHTGGAYRASAAAGATLPASRDSAGDVHHAAIAYLEAAEQAPAAACLRAARLTLKRRRDGAALVSLAGWRGDAAAEGALMAALTALLGPVALAARP
jgi:hypothetical protein